MSKTESVLGDHFYCYLSHLLKKKPLFEKEGSNQILYLFTPKDSYNTTSLFSVYFVEYL